MGGYWIMIKFTSEEAKMLFQSNVTVNTWFTQIQQASNDFTVEWRVACVEIEGIPLKIWSENTFKRIASKWGNLIHVDDQDNGNFYNKKFALTRTLLRTFLNDTDDDNSKDTESRDGMPKGEDLRKVVEPDDDSDLEIVRDTKLDENDNDIFMGHSNKQTSECPHTIQVEDVTPGHNKSDSKENFQDDVAESICSGHFKKSDIQRTGGSMLHVMEEVVKRCWGNFAFDYVHSASVGNSGEILCVWDPITFIKLNVTVLDYFVMVRGDWVPNGTKLLIISLYAPQELTEKKMLWDYLSHSYDSCPNISAITLDRYLSDHRPILMRETHYDYGPVPFRFFHYWFEIKEFDKLLEDSWNDAIVVESNVMTKFMKKLKLLKEKIRDGDEKVVNNGTNVVKSLQELKKLQSLEAAQKAKIKCPIEGDENSKYYHGILNKKRSQLAIREARRQLDLNFPNMLNSDQVTDLERVVSKDEIKRAVWDCGTDKSPGLDGFTFASNSSFIALILKTSDANMVKDFRPISLVGSMYKIIAKILANRLVFILGDLVNEIQSAFAFDSVRWDYLDDVLRRFGFGVKWCSWIQSCLRSSRGSVIVNGSLTEEFQFYKGLKQGDPLSPFLFILVMESLHISFQRVVDTDKGGLRISSLFVLNRALMFKWVWRFLSQNTSLWANVIKSIHGDQGKIGKKATASFSSTWLDIVKEVEVLKKTNLLSFIHKKLGNGSDTLFWEDAWHGDIAFKDLFPRVYALESCTNIDVASKLSHSNLAFSFRRDPRGGVEQVQFDLLMTKVANISLVNLRDRWIRSLEGSGDFSVASVKKLIDNHTLSNIATRTRWIKEVPIKVNVLTWKIKLDYLPTRLNISRRVEENGVTRPKKYFELSVTEAIQADCDIKATNIILQGLLPEFYALFLNTLPPEWSKFVTDVKLVRDLHMTNVDQLHAYLGQHEYHANEVCLMHERNSDPLALVANHQMTKSPYQTHQKSYQHTQFQPQVSSFQSSQYGSPYQSLQFRSHAQTSTPLSITYPTNDFQSSVHHNLYNPSSSIPQVKYAPSVHQQSEFS
nr:RNA-directed DNA polymerase, eukaryota, reverse transcriptase zinc-binding domain protein [Tanacetum cinerariifolium]